VKRTAWSRLRTSIAAALIGVLLWRLGTGAVLDGLRMIGPEAVCAALAVGLITTVLSAWRWRAVARRLDLRLPLRSAVADYYRAQFLNAVLPAGVLGDVHRAVRHGRQEGDVGRGVRAVVLERAAGQVVVIGVAGAVLAARPTAVPPRLHDAVIITGAVVATFVVAVSAVAVLIGDRWTRSGSRWRRASVVSLHDLRRGVLARGAWPAVVLVSMLAFAGHVTLFLVAARTAGSAAPAGRLLPLLVLSLVAMGLPVNVAGWGPREGMAAVAFGSAGLGAAQGLTVAVVYGVLAFVASVPGAAVLLWPALVRARPRLERARPKLGDTLDHRTPDGGAECRSSRAFAS
jgi:uncharacterized membrane protein YbhN (UPF0104 family)